ncbi:Uncharacterised protein [Psychrobacter phenylpyruvicus]|uniref:Uncharacterized protein n=1 Tax=Psychrobacter phenylpyruvicus TaxID=29432 RepID=A0A379LLW3_9GAMM|nr:Uncharacterised protein [Psychrobacter phenylpyruvicus]
MSEDNNKSKIVAIMTLQGKHPTNPLLRWHPAMR